MWMQSMENNAHVSSFLASENGSHAFCQHNVDPPVYNCQPDDHGQCANDNTVRGQERLSPPEIIPSVSKRIYTDVIMTGESLEPCFKLPLVVINPSVHRGVHSLQSPHLVLPESDKQPSSFQLPAVPQPPPIFALLNENNGTVVARTSTRDRQSSNVFDSTSSQNYSSQSSLHLRPSLGILRPVCIDQLYIAMDDLVDALLPKNLFERICEHLPLFSQYYSPSLVVKVPTWRDSTLTQITQKLRRSPNSDPMEQALYKALEWREDPTLLKDVKRRRDPLSRLMLQPAMKESIAKSLTRTEAKLKRLKDEEVAKKRVVKEKVGLLNGYLQKAEEIVVRIEEIADVGKRPNCTLPFASLALSDIITAKGKTVVSCRTGYDVIRQGSSGKNKS